MRVLVVDDEKFNIAVVKNILEREFSDLERDYCLDSREVLNRMAEKDYDVVLLDIVMPYIDGIEILRLIKESHMFPDVQMVMLTSITDDESFRKCFEYGAKDFIAKPIEIIEFTSRLKAALQNKRNITTLKTMVDQMQKQNNELANLNKQLEETKFHMIQKEKLASIGELAAGVAHEINNPMGYISSNLDTLAKYISKISTALGEIEMYLNTEGVQAEVVQELMSIWKKHKIDFILEDTNDLLNESKEGADKVSKIVKSLRNFARGEQADEKMNYLFSEVIDEVLMITRNESKYVAQIEEKFEPNLEVYCNKLQIQQVLINLIVNAAHAIKERGEQSFTGIITVEAYSKDDESVIQVIDNGDGIPDDVITKIFDPFFTTKEVGKGTGLGLSISYDIIHNKHHGEIIAKSVHGIGTTFIIRLPHYNPESEA